MSIVRRIFRQVSHGIVLSFCGAFSTTTFAEDTVCGDRHWQYHSKDPLGVEEFSCGALVDENSRLGREPGDPRSTDPNSEIHQFFTQSEASGGFLRITVGPAEEAAMGSALFTLMDDVGKILYETRKVQPLKN